MLFHKKIYFILISIFIFTNFIWSNSFNYFAGGSPIPLVYSNADNFNPAYALLLPKNNISFTNYFQGKKGYFQSIYLGFYKLPYTFRINFVSNYLDKKNIKFEFSGFLFKNVAVGFTMKSFLSGENTLLFDAGFLWDTGNYLLSITYFNLGGVIISQNFINKNYDSFLYKYENPELFFLDSTNNKLKEGVISTFIFNVKKKYFFSFSVNQFVNSWDKFVKLDWSNIYWGMIYILPDGSYIGLGTNSEYNSFGIGFLRGHISTSYVYLWQPKKVSKHVITLSLIW